MASIGHVAVGMLAGRLHDPEAPLSRRSLAMAAYSGLSVLPDLDVIAFGFDIPYGAPWGHRGVGHSLAVAIVIGALVALVVAWRGTGRWRAVALATLVVASHGLLDAMTDGGLGIALLWPFTDARFFTPLRPLPVAPIGPAVFSARGLVVVGTELLFFSPLFAAALWPSGRGRRSWRG